MILSQLREGVMFPLKADIPVTKLPYGLWLIISVNVFIYVYFHINPYGLLFADYGFLPLKLSMPSDIVSINEKALSFFTYIFLHDSLVCFIINMYFLYLFGKSVESHIGTIKFLCFYIMFGVTAAIIEAFINPEQAYPIVGAGGAVAGIIGLFFIFFPFSKIKTFIFLLIYAIIKNIPSWIIIGLFFTFRILWCNDSFLSVSGFISGIVTGVFIKMMEKIKQKSNML